MTSLWRKLNYLVPEPQCGTKNNQITEWTDARPRPTQAQIDAVTDQQVLDSEAEAEADNTVSRGKKDRLIFEINFDIENRLRILEGKPAITKQQYKTALKNLYKSL